MNIMLNAFTRSRSKSKAMPQEQYPPSQNAYSNIQPPQQAPPIWVPAHLQMQANFTQMPYNQPQPHVLPMTQQAHQPFHAMHTQTMNTCLHPCQPQHLIQSPLHQQQKQQSQSTLQCPVNGQMRTNGGTPIESRILTGQNQQLNMSNGGLMNNAHHQMQMQHVSICQSHHQAAASQAQFINHMQVYTNNPVQSPINQPQQQQLTTRFDSVDNSNSYYSNNQIAAVLPPPQQIHQQKLSPQMVQQNQREKSLDERQRQDQQQKTPMQQSGQNQRQMILPEQQQYQNHPIVNKNDTNGHCNLVQPNDDSSLPLEVACKLYHKDYQDLMGVAEKLKVDLSSLNEAISNGIVPHGMLGSSKGGVTPYKCTIPSKSNGAKLVQNHSVAVERFELQL